MVLDGITIEGERTHTRNETNATGYLLEKKTDGTVIGELPENGNSECEITFSILRPIGEIVKVHILKDEESKETEKRYSDMLANGQLPMEGDGWIYYETDGELSYSDSLQQTGLIEIADRL